MEINKKKSVYICLIEDKQIRYSMNCWRNLSKKQQIIVYHIIKVINNEKETIKKLLYNKVKKSFDKYVIDIINKYKSKYGNEYIDFIKENQYDRWLIHKDPKTKKNIYSYLSNNNYKSIPDYLVPIFVNIQTETNLSNVGQHYKYSLTKRGKKLWEMWKKIVEGE